MLDATDAFLADPTLQFIRVYFEWFDADRDAARLHFEDLRPLVVDAGVIDLLLREP